MGVRRFPKGERRLRLFHCPLVASAEAIPPATMKVKQHGCAVRRGQGGDRKAPLSPPQRRNPCVREKTFLIDSTTMSERPAVRSRPSGATQHRCWKEQLGGASEEAQSYWQGRFAACTFVGRVWRNGHPRNSWGVAPNPTRELRPLTPQGGFPLDPFLATRFGRASLIELFSGFSFTFYPVQTCSAGSASP